MSVGETEYPQTGGSLETSQSGVVGTPVQDNILDICSSKTMVPTHPKRGKTAVRYQFDLQGGL